MDIRPMTDRDIDAVAAVHIRTWQVAYAGIIPADYLDQLDPAVNAANRRSKPDPEGVRTVVAAEGDEVLGFASFGPYRGDPPGSGELYAVYVDHAAWGHGIGRLLLEAARSGLQESGFPDMRLWVLEENHPARRFYERMGLTPDGTRHYYTPRGTTVELPELRYATPL